MSKGWNKSSRGDRRVLLLLILVMVGMLLYFYFRSPQPDLLAHTSTLPTPMTHRDSLTTEVADEEPKQALQDSITGDRPQSNHPIRTERYPGPPTRPQYTPKLKAGATIDLNSADTLLLQRVPGIGPAFARRIVRYRKRLGGYYVVEQLQEVYGMDRERYLQIAPFMEIRTGVRPIFLSPDSIARHPYLQYRHSDVLRHHLQEGDTLTWPLLMQSGAFTHDDSLRLSPYLPLTTH